MQEVHAHKIGLERNQLILTQVQESRSYGLERNQLDTIQKLVQMVLKGVNWVHSDKIGSYHLERSQMYTQSIKFGEKVLKESIGSTIIKLVQMVLKGVN